MTDDEDRPESRGLLAARATRVLQAWTERLDSKVREVYRDRGVVGVFRVIEGDRDRRDPPAPRDSTSTRLRSVPDPEDS
jgi:hypothetical protein